MATINGTPANNTLNGTQQSDVLNANWSGGNDKMFGRNGNDQYNVNSIGDIVTEVGSGIDTVRSRLTNYTLTNNVENLVLDTGGVNGTGNGFDNLIEGNNGNNILRGNEGIDELYGFIGNDSLYGGEGNDILHGGQGNDILRGDLGDDLMRGFSGNDTYYVDSSGDTIDGEAPTPFFADMGIDTVYSGISRYQTLEAYVENLILTENAGANSFATGNAWNNQLTGNSFDNVLFGIEANDVLRGLDGNDQLDGGTGNDTLYGDSGNDWLAGYAGADTLYGSLGADTFYYSYDTTDSPNSAQRDTIVNFKGSEGDIISLYNIDADASTGGDEAFLASQINFNAATQILSADVYNSTNDLSIKLTGLEPGFDINTHIFL